MLKLKPAALPVGLLLIVLTSCFPGAPTPDANSVNTVLAEIVSSAQTQTAAAFTVTPITTPTFTSTSTATLSPTVTFTFTPAIPLVSVSVPTNCRIGPGRVYGRVGALLVGETTQIYGRDPTGRYWYVQNPDSPSNFCWLWGEYATVTGNFVALPVFTPPPTPTFTPTPLPNRLYRK